MAIKKLPKMKTDDLIEMWGSRVSRGVDFRYKETKEHWDELITFLQGDQWATDSDEAGSVNYKATVNICWHLIRSQVPSLYMDDPHILVRPDPHKKIPYEQLQQPAKWFESIMNREWRLGKTKEEMRRGIEDALVFSYGCIKVGWFGVSQESYDAMSVGDRPRNMEAYAKRISPGDIVLDPDARDIKTARWVAETALRPYYDVINDDRYVGYTGLKDLEPTWWSNNDTNDQGEYRGSQEGGKRDGWIRTWEVMTHEDGGKLLTFAESPEGSSKYGEGDRRGGIEFGHLLREVDLPYKYLNHFPYHFLQFNKVPDHLYGPSDLELIKDQQKELNYIRSIQADHVRNQKAIHIYKPGEVPEDTVADISTSPDGSMIGIDTTEHLPNVFHTLQSSPVPPDLYAMINMLKGEIFEVGGMDQASRNASMKDETATAVMARGHHSSLRMSDRAAIVKDWLIGVAYDYAQIKLKEDEPKNIYPVMVEEDQTGQQREVQLAIEDFQAEFKIALEARNTFPASREIEVNQFLSAVNLLANNPDVSQRELAKRTLELFEIHGIDKIIPPAPAAEIMRILSQAPDLAPRVMQFIMQQIQQAQAQQGQQPAQGGEQGRVMADPNQFQQSNVPNQGNASAAQGGNRG